MQKQAKVHPVFDGDYGIYSLKDYRGTFMPLEVKKVKTVLSARVGDFRNRYISGISWYHWPQDTEETCILHNFQPHRVVQPHQCLVCKKIIWNQGSSCVDCHIICHRKCETEVMTTCAPTGGIREKNDFLTQTILPEALASPTSEENMSELRNMITKSQGEDRLVLDLTYVMERIIAISFPAEGHDELYSYALKDVANMLKTKHGDKYLVINLSEKREDLSQINVHVVDFGWPDHLAPPLERLCSICKSIDSWLNSDPQHVVVIHCKGGKGRIAVVTAAYMNYCNICSSKDQALDRFAMKRFYDDKLGGLPQPSQRRYVHYFTGLLSSAININSEALYLHHILIHGVPNFDSVGGCRPFIKVYQGMQPMFTSGIYTVTDKMQKVWISISPGIPLRGDVLIKCYHKKSKGNQREIIWRCQFHTCAISESSLVFSKQELDEACNDSRFPDNGKVEFVFSRDADGFVQVSGFDSFVQVPVDDGGDGLVRSDSYGNFNNLIESSTNADVNANGLDSTVNINETIQHSEGPLDGSLYATVNKRRMETTTTTSTTYVNGINGSVHDSSYSVNETAVPKVNPVTQSSTEVHTVSSSSTTKPEPTKPLDEHRELDALLEGLLNDQVFESVAPVPVSVSETSTVTSSYSETHQPMSYVSKKTEIIKESPVYIEESHYTVTKSTEEKMKHVPKNAFSYTAPPPVETKVVKETETTKVPDKITSPALSPKSYTLPYRADYENTYSTSYTTESTSHMDSEALSWLEQQQQKLKMKKEDDDGKRSSQEKALVEELKHAQSRYANKRAKSDVEEQEVMQSYVNGPSSPITIDGYTVYQMSVNPQSATHRTHKQQNDEVFDTTVTETHSRTVSKPPPSPGPTIRTTSIVTPPVTPPVRSSSKDYMQRQRSNSRDWPSQQRPPRVSASAASVVTTYEVSSSQTNNEVNNDLEAAIQAMKTTTVKEATPPPKQLTPEPVVAPPPPQPIVVQQQQQHQQQQHQEFVQHKTESYTTVTSQTFESQKQQHHQQQQSTQVPKEQPLEVREIEEDRISLRPIGPGVQTLEPDSMSTLGRPTTPAFPVSPASSVATPPFPVSPGTPYVNPSTPFGHSNYHFRSRGHSVLNPGLHSGYATTMITPSGAVLLQSAITPSSSAHFTTATAATTTTTLEDRSQQQPPPPAPSQGKYYRQSARYSDPLYASIPEVAEPHLPAGSQLSSPTGTLTGGQNSQYNTLIQQQSYQTSSSHQQQSSVSQPHQMAPQPDQLHLLQQQQKQQLQQQQQLLQQQQQQQQLQYQQQLQQQQLQQQQQQQQFQQQIQQQQQHFQQYSSSTMDGSATLPPGSSLHVDTSPRSMSATLPRSPSSAGSPPSPGSLNILRQQLSSQHMGSSSAISPGPLSMGGQSSPSVYFGLSRRGSMSSLAESDLVQSTPKFVKDTSKFWYKPNISREDAILMLKDKAPGIFVVRDSNSFPGAFGLALKVAQVPPNVQTKAGADPASELVRHFLIEPTPKGVRLRGCSNEPVFGTLAALVYQHSITPLALPCKLVLPESDPAGDVSNPESPHSSEIPSSAAALLATGAACNVLYLNTVDTESLTGPQAVAKAAKVTFSLEPAPKTTVVHFKVSSQGITLTDNNRKLFFRRHYPVAAVTYCGIDPEDRRWIQVNVPGTGGAKVFGFIARKQGGVSDNACHLFAELDPEQPAFAIVNFVTKVMVGPNKIK